MNQQWIVLRIYIPIPEWFNGRDFGKKIKF